MAFPETRLRRLRKSENIRKLVRENHLSIDDLIYPVFVCEGISVREEIGSMPEVYRISIDVLVEECREIVDLGISSVLLFGIPNEKDELGSDSYNDNGIIQKAIRAIKSEFEDLIVITDVCFCEYTSHGHCGVLACNGDVENDATLELLKKQVVSHAKAGADIVAPSDMMDGRVKAIRSALDENGYQNIPIMAYSAKYSSAFYGPFRDAVDSAPKSGDRKTYQMDCANSDEAMREVEQDIIEGADFVMVKPALSYLDIIYRVKNEFNTPVVAYNVSGEYSMVKGAGEKNYVDAERVMMEILLSIKRAGADVIITYHAKEVAKILKGI